MISDVDEALRNLILDSLTVSRQNVDIKYDLPSRDWASRLNRPTIQYSDVEVAETKAYTFPLPITETEAAQREDNR